MSVSAAKKKEVVRKPAPRKPVQAKKAPVEKVETVDTTQEDARERANAPEDIVEVDLGLPDKSSLTAEDQHQVLINLLKTLPFIYRETEEQLKRNVHNIARFEPTREMIRKAQEAIDNEPVRNSG
jgi:hypothetical protein